MQIFKAQPIIRVGRPEVLFEIFKIPVEVCFAEHPEGIEATAMLGRYP